MLRGAATTKTPLARAGASDRSQVPSSLSANAMKPSRLLNSHSQTPEQRFSKMKRASSDDALAKPALGQVPRSRMRKTVTSGAISDLADSKIRTTTGIPPKKSGIPAPKEMSTTVSRERVSLRDQLKGASTKKMVPSASTSSLSTLAKRGQSAKPKLDADGADKALLECQVKELLAEAKAKDFEISKLRMELQRYRGKASPAEGTVASTTPTEGQGGEGEPAGTSPVDPQALVGELKEKNGRFQRELAALRDENQALKEKLISLESAPVPNATSSSSPSPTKPSVNGILPDSTAIGDAVVPAISKIPLKSSTSSGSDITKGSASASPSPDSSEFEKIPSRCNSLSSGGAGGGDLAATPTTPPTREQSVECLTEKIQQMEESHHSTSEELQATLQELSDQQQVVTELTSENERLAEQKHRLQASLQEQRERVELLAQKNEALLLRLRDQRDESARATELEQRCGQLVESARFEREKLVDIQQQLTGSLRQLEQEHQEAQADARGLREERERLRAELEREREGRGEAERAAEEREGAVEVLRAEVERVRAQLEAERQKVAELKAVQSASADSTELQGLLKAAHDERDRLELECTRLRQDAQQAHADNEQTRTGLAKAQAELQQVLKQEEEQKSMLSGSVTELQEHVQQAEAQIKDLKETIFELEDHVEQQQAVHLHTKQTILDLENQLKKVEEHKTDVEKQLKAMNRQMKEDKEEWLRFQADLQTAVVVANDIKVEAQQEVRALRRHLQEEQERSGRLAGELEQLQLGRLQSDERSPPPAEERAQWCGIPVMTQTAPASLNGSESSSGGTSSSQAKTAASVKSLIKNFDRPLESEDTSHSLSLLFPSNPSLTSGAQQLVDGPAKALKVSLSTRSPLSGIPVSTSPSATVHPTQRHTAIKPLSKTTPRKVNFSHPDPLSGPSDELKPASFMRKSPSLESVIKSPAALCTSLGSYSYTWDNSKLRAERKDPLAALAREYGGSKRNALLKWCQKKTEGYPNIDMTNFSSSWSDGLAFCALLHSYLPAHIPYQELIKEDKVRNLTLAFQAAESIGIKPSLDIDDMMHTDRPDWQSVMHYVSQIYKYFET
ncbi:cytospin-B isoform X1 [Alosa sapidissima]|uniref:cytospin-B isoform X1 n=1 Tax=Alosa sapidissima TaxID=34773 RepID=UPI001C08630D|nr:cytospin-B isoform X1 [Alosa sapidissima]XP_041947088.1 cytospin-B isoform X1 [Alosa sapidissima]XP_041947089.1 cytospin-B isoform X1 [Alosa sapidissima]XP_041947090.1 cytospin-B isoform X1 [Alosa sapidissima]XP_041947091.1 cytospin-B isoform X1 [Alosa sapidissima]XP_041947092.1 cytospin-B isoform X1 [Alosa sapidissima]